MSNRRIVVSVACENHWAVIIYRPWYGLIMLAICTVEYLEFCYPLRKLRPALGDHASDIIRSQEINLNVLF